MTTARETLPPDLEFSENCGLDDAGNHVMHPFQECPPGQCNRNSAELCSLCGGGATAPIPSGSRGGTGWPCREVLVRFQRAWAGVQLEGAGQELEA